MHSRPPAIHFEKHQTNHDKEKQKGIASSSGLEAQGWSVSPQPNMTSYAVIRKISSSRTDGEMDSISNINFKLAFNYWRKQEIFYMKRYRSCFI